MSQSVNTYLVNDSRCMVADHINFAVLKGAQSKNEVQFIAQSAGPNNINFSCLIPSLTTLIDRHVLIKSTFQITLSGNVEYEDEYLVDTGLQNVCLSNFPFSNLINTCQVQLNNTTLNTNYQDVLDLMLRQQEQKDLDKYGDMTPTQFDTYGDVNFAGSLSVFNGIDNANDYPNLPRGAFLSIDDVVNTASTSNGGISTSVLTISVTEPLMVSPFIFGDTLDGENSALSGVSVININMNLNANCARAIRFTNSGATNVTATLTSVSQGATQALFTFLNPKPSQMIPLTNVLPYYELPCYKTQRSTQTVALKSTFNVTSTIVSPNCVPDKLFLFVRKVPSERTVSDMEYYYSITNVNITWNTQSGILANASLEQLYQMSKRAGMKIPFLQYVGRAYDKTLEGNAPLNGGILALDFSTMIPLIEDYNACSSLGSFNFGVTVTCINNSLSTTIPNVELNVVFMNSGLISTTSGTTNTFIGILNRQEVLSVSQEESVSDNEHKRLVGGSWLSSLKSALPAIKKIGVALGKKVLDKSTHPVAQVASSILGSGMTGGEIVGGRKRHPRIY